ncbi:hypothetical protein Hanom_Chr00s001010g01671341 [Helianthus anomalus]
MEKLHRSVLLFPKLLDLWRFTDFSAQKSWDLHLFQMGFTTSCTRKLRSVAVQDSQNNNFEIQV